MMVSSRSWVGSLLVVVLLPVRVDANDAALNLRWGLSRGEGFFHEITSEDPQAPRVFEIDEEKAKAEGAEQCATERKNRKPTSDYCEGLAARIAPVLDFAFDTARSGTIILDSIEVECYKASRYRGVGFSKDIARYDLELPAGPGVKRSAPPKPLTFTNTGVIQLRCWPDDRAGGLALDLSFRFHFRSGKDLLSAETGRFTLRF